MMRSLGARLMKAIYIAVYEYERDINILLPTVVEAVEVDKDQCQDRPTT